MVQRDELIKSGSRPRDQREAVSPDQSLGEHPSLEFVRGVELAGGFGEPNDLGDSSEVFPAVTAVAVRLDRHPGQVVGDHIDGTPNRRQSPGPRWVVCELGDCVRLVVRIGRKPDPTRTGATTARYLRPSKKSPDIDRAAPRLERDVPQIRVGTWTFGIVAEEHPREHYPCNDRIYDSAASAFSHSAVTVYVRLDLHA